MLSLLLKINKVDDPVSGVAVNLGGGLVGSLVTGLALLAETHDGMVVGWQLVGVVVVSAWVVTLCLVVMLPLLLCGKLRIKDAHEKLGADCVKVLEEAYSFPLNVEGRHHPGDGDLSRMNTRSAMRGIEKDRSPVCAFVSPCIREQLVEASPFTSTSKMYPTNTISNWSMDTKTTTPRIVLERPSPATSLQSLVPPPPPSYFNTKSPQPTQLETSLTVPEISVTASDTSSQDNSQTPLLANPGQADQSIAFDVKELRVALKEQRGRLKNMNSLLKSPSFRSVEEEYDHGNDSISSAGSDISVKSEVVRQTVKTASNKENFNYLAGTKKLDDNIEDVVGRPGSPLQVDNDIAENSITVKEKEKEFERSKAAVCDESVKGDQEFDYSKKDIDDGLAQTSHVEVKEIVDTNSTSDVVVIEKCKESGLI